MIALALAIALGIPAATRVARESQRKDPGFVVIDEVAGQLIALIALTPDWPHALLALLLFRFFDILKPPPIRRLEALPEGTGIVVDDLGAGLYALISCNSSPTCFVITRQSPYAPARRRDPLRPRRFVAHL